MKNTLSVVLLVSTIVLMLGVSVLHGIDAQILTFEATEGRANYDYYYIGVAQGVIGASLLTIVLILSAALWNAVLVLRCRIFHQKESNGWIPTKE